MEGYRGIRAQMYDTLAAFRSPEDIKFYIEEATKAGSPVLEIGTGTGRVLIPLVEAGLEVVGVEPFLQMRQIAQMKIAKLSSDAQKRVQLAPDDMRALNLNRRFQCALIPYRAFHHLLEIADQRKALRSIHDHLEPGGTLVIHNGDPDMKDLVAASGAGSGVQKLREFSHPENGHRVIIWGSRKCDLTTQISEWHNTYEEIDESGKTVSRIHNVDRTRHIFVNEMRYLLELCGFEIQDLFSDFRRSPYRYAKEQVWIAQKI